MDPRFHDLSFSVDDFIFQCHVPLSQPNKSLPHPNKSPNIANGFISNEPAVGFHSLAASPLFVGPDALNNMPEVSTVDFDEELVIPAEPSGGSLDPSMSPGKSLTAGRGSCPSSDDSNSTCPALKYITEILMGENMEEEVWINPDDVALQNTEKSLYDALGEQYPDLPDNFQHFVTHHFIESPSNSLSGNSGKKSSIGTSYTSTSSSNSIDTNLLHVPRGYDQTATSVIHPLDQIPQFNSLSNSMANTNGLVESFVPAKNIFKDNDSVLQYERGLEEASKFLPPSSQLAINLESVSSCSGSRRGILEVGIHENEGSSEDVLDGFIGRKNHKKENPGLVKANPTEQTSSLEEAELSDMLDKVLLCTEKVEPPSPAGSCLSPDASKDLQTGVTLCGFSVGTGQGRRRGSNSSVDLRALLVLCAQALSSNDLRTANELLKQIRKSSSPSGDGSQRLAHHFANGLEARMVGKCCMTQSYYATVAGKKSSVADMLKAYRHHFSSCPFMRLSIFYMNSVIQKLSQMTTILHIIDFGIDFGFKWPILIQKLGEQAGGPPKLLRITGIELPHPGLHPAQKIEETGRRLARYCERFNVPFEYNALPSQNWEAIKIEDLKIKSGETLVVTCLMRFENLLDETAEEDSPRDVVLNLVRRIKPDIFVHAVRNGSYNSPFFVTRFREALFHLSSIYDMLDATSEHSDSEERTILESEVYGREIMNVVACEGPERVDRPETYKQWQVRHVRAGFKQLPLDRAMVKRFRHKLEAWYHRDFALDEDGDWMLMGWKGRTMSAATCWVPV